MLCHLRLLNNSSIFDEQKKHKNGVISRSENYNRTKYVQSFQLINEREDINDKDWKYERICLLLVDFSKTPPEPIIGLPEKKLDSTLFPQLDVNKVWKCLDYRDFFSTLVEQAKKRNETDHCMPIKQSLSIF